MTKYSEASMNFSKSQQCIHMYTSRLKALCILVSACTSLLHMRSLCQLRGQEQSPYAICHGSLFKFNIPCLVSRSCFQLCYYQSMPCTHIAHTERYKDLAKSPYMFCNNGSRNHHPLTRVLE